MKQLPLSILIFFSFLTRKAYSKDNRSSLEPKRVPDRFKNENQQTEVKYFPEIEYPSTILEREPFFYKSYSGNLDAFSEDVKSTFEHINEAKKIKTSQAVKESTSLLYKTKEDRDLKTNLKKGMTDAPKETKYEIQQENIQRNSTDVATDVPKVDSETNNTFYSNETELVLDITKPKQYFLDGVSEISKVDPHLILEEAKPLTSAESLNYDDQKNKPCLSEISIDHNTGSDKVYQENCEFSSDEVKEIDYIEIGQENKSFINGNLGKIQQLPSNYFLSDVIMYVTNGTTTIIQPKMFKGDDSTVNNKEGTFHDFEDKFSWSMLLNDTEDSFTTNNNLASNKENTYVEELYSQTANNEIELAQYLEKNNSSEFDVITENLNFTSASKLPVASYFISQDILEFEDQIPAPPFINETKYSVSEVNSFQSRMNIPEVLKDTLKEE